MIYSELLWFQGDAKNAWRIMEEGIEKTKLIHSILPRKIVIKPFITGTLQIPWCKNSDFHRDLYVDLKYLNKAKINCWRQQFSKKWW